MCVRSNRSVGGAVTVAVGAPLLYYRSASLLLRVGFASASRLLCDGLIYRGQDRRISHHDGTRIAELLPGSLAPPTPPSNGAKSIGGSIESSRTHIAA